MIFGLFINLQSPQTKESPMRQFLCFSLAMILSFTSTNAYTLEQPQLPEQIEAAILLNEDGTPRCRIGSAAELDTLRECDERDELYARTIFDTEEISLGAAAPASFYTGMKVILVSASVAIATSCIVVGLNDWIDMNPSRTSFLKFLGGNLILATVGIVGGFVLPATIAIKIAAGSRALEATGIISAIWGVGTGFLICSGVVEETSDGNE